MAFDFYKIIRIKRRQNFLILLSSAIFTILYYGYLLTNGHFDVFHETYLGLTFNNMLVHLLDGKFDVDPAIVAKEGFLRDGRVYAYWGVFGALLRLPLLAWRGAIDVDITRLSCLCGVCIGGYFKIWSLLLVMRHSPPSPARTLMVGVFGAWLLIGGAQIGFLRVSIFQEVVFWASAMAAIFVYAAIRALLLRHFSLGTLSVMALMAGLAVNTRISTGIGLCVAFGLLTILLIHQEFAQNEKDKTIVARLYRAATRRRFLPSFGILCVLVAVGAMVNVGRWGSPVVFADYSHYLGNADYPDRIPRTIAYGLFNFGRIPLGLIYYFFPIWVLHGPDGSLILDSYRYRLIDAAELPPGSFLLTDALPIILVGALFWRIDILRRWSAARSQILALAAGLAIPGCLMLAAISMTYRYRMEFYPLLEFSGLLAILGLSRCYTETGMSVALRRSLVAATVMGVAAAHLLLVLYKLAPLGPGQVPLQHGIVALYDLAFRRGIWH